ncbi:Sulfur carrier protein moaD [Phocoenobacter uteri]|uniref:Molybdopterin synthase sulfur carrier subunit n=1 Tax=Phocoenobacter uteri TaxID=146806 RepID=A0A379C9W8_9PAST|nr:MoaD/ThiS family protein [Phocoenobacter uteri]MDG6882328.1 hypothetical protein [Phocoenobacter uteri]SUB58486.1 Sulfur carrier protein moaD [Phocoenobacter uteri]
MSVSNNTFKILYFAVFQEKANKSEEIRPLSDSLTAEMLFSNICTELGVELSQKQVRVSVNHQFTAWDTVIMPNDIVAFIPPVAGG